MCAGKSSREMPLVPAELAPAELAPAELAPAELAPAELAPAELAPALPPHPVDSAAPNTAQPKHEAIRRALFIHPPQSTIQNDCGVELDGKLRRSHALQRQRGDARNEHLHFAFRLSGGRPWDTVSKVRREQIQVAKGHLEITISGRAGHSPRPLICASHPIDAFAEKTTRLLANAAGADVVCVNLRGIGGSSALAEGESYELTDMVEELEAVRLHLTESPWVFWGMSGGGWLGQLYAQRHPEALRGLVLESICAALSERLVDPECALSPKFPAWQTPLGAAGLLRAGSLATKPPNRHELEWREVIGVGSALCQRGGPALLISPPPPSPTMKRVLPLLLELDARPWLRQLRAPSLVICGTADPILPIRHALALQAAMPGSQFLAVEGAGHVPVAEERAEVGSAVRALLARI